MFSYADSRCSWVEMNRKVPNIETKLASAYHQFNRREYVRPDPLEFLYNYPSIRDREIVGLTASALAYGRVAMIKRSVGAVLEMMGPSPADYVATASSASLRRDFSEFKHRFATGEHLSAMLTGARNIIREQGSLHACFLQGCDSSDATVLPALTRFCEKLVRTGDPGHLVPRPERGSACKRMHLFLRWMVRKDAVDPGGWENMDPSKLIVPLDVHMHRVCTFLGLTSRKAADLKTALEITAAFARWVPEDPVRFDFALTRFGIRGEMSIDEFFS